jgi:hypothetical protein
MKEKDNCRIFTSPGIAPALGCGRWRLMQAIT